MLFSFGDVHIVGTGGSNYELWWIRGVEGVIKIACAHSFLDGQLERLEILFSN
jgi:hypothetical protein